MTDSTSGTISRSSFLRSFGGTKRLVHSPFFSPLHFELVMMDTNHSTRMPIPEIYTSSTKYFEGRDKKGDVSRTRKFRTTEKYFLEWSVDDEMKTVFG